MSLTSVLAKDSVRNLIMPVTVDQYHKFGEAGFIPEKTELIDGIILRKMPKSPLHEYVTDWLYRFFADRLDAGYWVRKEAPLTLQYSEPEPDVSIVKGQREKFIKAHPSRAELVIEVAVSSLDLDREKAAVYAGASIPEYWIVLADAKLIERYSDPQAGQYRAMLRFDASQSISILGNNLVLKELFV